MLLVISLSGILTSEKKLHRSCGGSSSLIPVTMSEIADASIQNVWNLSKRGDKIVRQTEWNDICAGQKQTENIEECHHIEIADSTVEA